jgi:hypothetical protein
MLEKLLGSYDNVDMHHEYRCNDIQPLGVKYSLGVIDINDALSILENLHGEAINKSEKEFWGDSSNKLSWLIPLLDKLFPNAKFIHLIRDGRKVVSSFYNKLGNECYDDTSTNILQNWVDNPKINMEPPHEKKYWWNVAKANNNDKFRSYNQFQRICHHWKSINEIIQNDLEDIGKNRKIFIKLEELVTNESKLQELIQFIGLDYKEELFNQLKRPHNVHIPKNFDLTKVQYKQFYEICMEMMIRFDYNPDDKYKVGYNESNPIIY